MRNTKMWFLFSSTVVFTLLFAVVSNAEIPPTVDNVKNVVRDYGAVGNGVDDDTAAIQAAINGLGSHDTLFFPAGNYKTSSALTISGKANVTLSGRGAKITCASLTDDAVKLSGCSYINLIGFFIMNANGGSGLTIENSPRTNLTEIKIWDCKKYNLYTTNSWWLNASGCYFRKCGAGYNAVYLGTNSNSVNFTDCLISTVDSNNNTAVACDGGSKINFTGCDISNSKVGFKITKSSVVAIMGCYFEGNETSISFGDASNWPIFLTIDSCYFNIGGSSPVKTGVHLLRGSNISIRNSHFTDGGFVGTAMKAENVSDLSRVLLDQVSYTERVGTVFNDPGYKIKTPSLVNAH